MIGANGHDGNGKAARPRLAILGMPGYGDQTAGAARGFWRASRREDIRLDRHYAEGSLLANNFNQLWCLALNAAHLGDPPAYFAMQHADVEPEDWWLDQMIDELEANDLDFLGAVIPIKDARGVTSLALQGGEREPWSPLCRLTMTDCYRLPPTFTSEDVGYPILLNTGLWVCKFDEAWAKKVHFEINDKIVFSTTADRYQAVNESEDWYFGRLCHEIGLKVGATRKIPLTHRGPHQFANDRAWGHPWDAASQKESPLSLNPSSGRYVMPPINGWMTYAEGEKLQQLARGKRVLEVGSYRGLSTITMARTAAEVYSVDTHDGRGTAQPAETEADLRHNIRRFDLVDKVSVYVGTLAEFAADYQGPPFDLVFIDGDHSREAVEADIHNALWMLAPDGHLAFHDYRNHSDPGVAEAVDALLGTGGELVSLTDSLAVVRPPAEVLSPLEV